jgi:hypothetical protein
MNKNQLIWLFANLREKPRVKRSFVVQSNTHAADV